VSEDTGTKRVNRRGRVGAFGIAASMSGASAVVVSAGLVGLVAVSLPDSGPPSEDEALLTSGLFWLTAMAVGLVTLVLVDIGRWTVWMAPFTAGTLIAVGLVTASAMQKAQLDGCQVGTSDTPDWCLDGTTELPWLWVAWIAAAAITWCLATLPWLVYSVREVSDPSTEARASR
jgi:hypothetical protein